MSPDFPVRRPGQLLAALSEELASNLDGDRQQSLLASFHGYVAEINEQLSAEPPPADPLDNLKHPLFERILIAFGDLLASLPQPPLFILDTCEELAKIDPVSAKIPGVEAMFYILERLHDRVRSLRVVLAGRRLLAQGGEEWTVDQERLSREARRLPDPRGYLGLHVLRGFTEAEVDSYLAAQKITLSAPGRTALLAQCPDAGGIPGLAATHAVDTAPRYNPFDVALYAGWINDDPDLDLAKLAVTDTDPYVEKRILGRLESDDLRAAMPAFTLLRRFDRWALALLFPGAPGRVDALYRLLGEQEWTEYQSDGSGGALEINRALLPRIVAYFEHPARRSSLEAARVKLGPLLAEALRTTRLEECRIETIDAALRAVPAAEAAALWADFERRIALGSAFSWAVRVAGRLLGDGAAAAAESPLRVAIQATHTSAITREQPTLNLGPAWEEIDRRALKYPQDARMRALHARAVAGQIASARVTRKTPSSEQIDALIGIVGERLFHDDAHKAQVLGAYAAAIDAALDTGTNLASAAIVPLFGRQSGERLHGVDAERWTSAMLLRRLARGLVPDDIVNDAIQHEEYDASRVAVCEAHRSTPPLLVALAHAIAAAGDPTRALALLDARLEAATAAGNDKPTIVAVQRAKLAVMHRYRIDPGPFALRLAKGPDADLRDAANHALSFTSAGAITVDPVDGASIVVGTSWLGLGSAPPELASIRDLRARAERDLITVERRGVGDPDRGAEELLEVSGAFIKTGDSVGALMAAIAATLAAARAGRRRNEIQAALSVVKIHYNAVEAALGDGVLPDYFSLDECDLVAGAVLIEKAPAGWQEWLFRLIVCLHVARPRRTGEGDRLLAAALEASYGAAVPAELDFLPRPVTSPSAPAVAKTSTVAPGQVPQANRLRIWLINGVVGILIVGVAAGVIYLAI